MMTKKDMALFILETCESTNLELKDKKKYSHWDAVIALEQTAGRGQRGNKWNSEPGKNLTFSVLLEPLFLRASRQFLLSEAVALALTDTLADYGIDARIKWPNDIYVGDKKICGVLIEHDLKGEYLGRTIAGIGLNVNQTVFSDSLPNPVSMAVLTGRRYDIYAVYDKVMENLKIRYDRLEYDDADKLQSDYEKLLYRINEKHKFMIPNEGPVEGTIRRVEPSGRLIVEIEGFERGFLFKEIEFVK